MTSRSSDSIAAIGAIGISAEKDSDGLIEVTDKWLLSGSPIQV